MQKRAKRAQLEGETSGCIPCYLQAIFSRSFLGKKHRFVIFLRILISHEKVTAELSKNCLPNSVSGNGYSIVFFF